MIRRWLAVLAALTLAGCASIPRSGPVVEGGVITGVQPRGFQAVAEAPVTDATPAQLLRGFIASMVQSDDGYGASRAFLTQGLSATWRPGQDVLVVRGIPSSSLDSMAVTDRVPTGTTVNGTVTVNQLAAVDAGGSYHAIPTAQRVRTLPVTLIKGGDGQWRVSEFPDVVVIGEQDFTFLYRAYRTYFLTADNRYLVPLLRWLPGGAPAATLLTQAVLAGPGTGLSQALHSAVPAQTALAPPGSVTTRGTTAVVDLTSAIRSATQEDRHLLREQLRSTLAGLLGTDNVELRVDGGVLDSSGVQSPELAPAPAGDPIFLQQGRIVRWGASPQPVPGLPSFTGASNPGVGPDGDSYAVLFNRRGQLRVANPGTPLSPVLLRGDDLTPPSLDRFGWIWSTEARNGGTISVIAPDNRVHRVSTGFLTGRVVTSIRISSDGARAAVVSRADPGSAGRLDVVAVQRAADGTPQALVRFQESMVSEMSAGVLAAQWVSLTEVLVLVNGGVVWRVSTDTAITVSSGRVVGAEVLAAGGPGIRSAVVIDSHGTAYDQSGLDWIKDPQGEVRDPAYPG